MGSSPTPGAIIVESYEYFIRLKRQNNIDNLQKSDQTQITFSNSREKTIKESIVSICKYQKPFIRKSLYKLFENSIENTEIVCKYIIAEQNEINIKESTKEGKIKTLINISKFLDFKGFDGKQRTIFFHILIDLENQRGMILITDGSEPGTIDT